MPTNRGPGDPNQDLSDGRVTLEIMPWDVQVFDKTGIVRRLTSTISASRSKMPTRSRKRSTTRPNDARRPLRAVVVLTDRDEDRGARRHPPKAAARSGSYQFCDNDGVMFDIAS